VRRPYDRLELIATLSLGVLLLLGAAVPLSLSFSASPERIECGEVQLTGACPHKAHTGTPCPTCGMTRAWTAASRGRLADAWRYNRAALPLYGLNWLILLGSGGIVLWSGRSLIRRRRGDLTTS